MELDLVWGHHLELHKYIINNECIKGKEVEKVQDPTPPICGFHNPLSGISSSTEVPPKSRA